MKIVTDLRHRELRINVTIPNRNTIKFHANLFDLFSNVFHVFAFFFLLKSHVNFFAMIFKILETFII